MNNKKIFSENLNNILKSRDISRAEFARIMNYPETTVSNWANQVSYPRIDKIQEMADYFGILKSDLTEEKKQGFMPTIECPYVPEGVAAGLPMTIDGYQELPTLPVPIAFLGKYAKRKDIVIMKVNGESMNKIIPNGSHIALITNITLQDLKDGDLVVFNYNAEYSLKHYYNLGNEILFKPNSTDLSFREIRVEKTSDLKIEGKVIMYNILLK